MIEAKHPRLSLSRQCRILGLNRSSYYYRRHCRKGRALENREKAWISAEWCRRPFYGYRKIFQALEKHGHRVSAKRVRRLMVEMGLKALCPQPDLSKPAKAHKKYPYLLSDISISYRNQAWASDLTYLKLPTGYVYLVAILDLYSRKVLSWRLSNTADTHICLEALDEALLLYGPPEIFNTDQGSQFTSDDFTERLLSRRVRISMDGKGRALDNIYVERLWRTLKYEDIYLKGYDDFSELKAGVSRYFEFYNTERFHQSLKYKTPDQIYFAAAMARAS